MHFKGLFPSFLCNFLPFSFPYTHFFPLNLIFFFIYIYICIYLTNYKGRYFIRFCRKKFTCQIIWKISHFIFRSLIQWSKNGSGSCLRKLMNPDPPSWLYPIGRRNCPLLSQAFTRIRIPKHLFVLISSRTQTELKPGRSRICYIV